MCLKSRDEEKELILNASGKEKTKRKEYEKELNEYELQLRKKGFDELSPTLKVDKKHLFDYFFYHYEKDVRKKVERNLRIYNSPDLIDACVTGILYELTSGPYKFIEEEFIPPSLSSDNLLNLILSSKYSFNCGDSKTTIGKLNKLLETPDLYDQIIKKIKISFSEEIERLVRLTKEYHRQKCYEIIRHHIRNCQERRVTEEDIGQQYNETMNTITIPTVSTDTTDEYLREKYNERIFVCSECDYSFCVTEQKYNELIPSQQVVVKILNRKILEEAYPDQTPKSIKRAPLSPDNGIPIRGQIKNVCETYIKDEICNISIFIRGEDIIDYIEQYGRIISVTLLDGSKTKIPQHAKGEYEKDINGNVIIDGKINKQKIKNITFTYDPSVGVTTIDAAIDEDSESLGAISIVDHRESTPDIFLETKEYFYRFYEGLLGLRKDNPEAARAIYYAFETGLSTEEISKELGVSIDTVKQGLTGEYRYWRKLFELLGMTNKEIKEAIERIKKWRREK